MEAFCGNTSYCLVNQICQQYSVFVQIRSPFCGLKSDATSACLCREDNSSFELLRFLCKCAGGLLSRASKKGHKLLNCFCFVGRTLMKYSVFMSFFLQCWQIMQHSAFKTTEDACFVVLLSGVMFHSVLRCLISSFQLVFYRSHLCKSSSPVCVLDSLFSSGIQLQRWNIGFIIQAHCSCWLVVVLLLLNEAQTKECWRWLDPY